MPSSSREQQISNNQTNCQATAPTIYSVFGDGEHSTLELLHSKTGFNKQALKSYAQNGAVWITRSAGRKPERLRRLKKVLLEKQKVELYFNAELLGQTVTEPELICDMQQYSVWLKPRGMLSQGSKWADYTALYRWVETHYQPNGIARQSWIVHRLDRATSGLMLIAHSKKMANTLSNLFETKQVHKSYKALVWGQFPDQPQTINSEIDGKPAISHITRLATYKDNLAEERASLVEVNIETGRKHQIRRHLSQMGYPIIGDRLHGDTELNQKLDPMPDLQLTAYRLSLLCPVEHIDKTFSLTDAQLNLLTEAEIKKLLSS